MIPIPVKLKVSEQSQFNLKVDELNISWPIDLKFDVVTNIFPTYSGPHSIVPSDTDQVLNTSNKILDRDIVIEKIPQNYGLITWNGSFITVS